MSPETLLLLQELLDQTRLQVGVENFEELAERFVRAKRELNEALTEAKENA